jgi:peroxiredoxin
MQHSFGNLNFAGGLLATEKEEPKMTAWLRWNTCLLALGIGLIAVAPATAQPGVTQAVDGKSTASRLLEVMKVGQTAKDVEFVPLKGEAKVKLSELTKDGPVVLVVLRGFPGYQCPICSRQVADLRRNADEFTQLGAKVVLVYPGPGPAADLKQKAEEFLAGAELPKPLTMVVDPEYSFTNLYELRWNATRETAYPSTFVLDTKRVVHFRKISETHADRAPTRDVLAALAKLQPAAGANSEKGARK